MPVGRIRRRPVIGGHVFGEGEQCASDRDRISGGYMESLATWEIRKTFFIMGHGRIVFYFGAVPDDDVDDVVQNPFRRPDWIRAQGQFFWLDREAIFRLVVASDFYTLRLVVVHVQINNDFLARRMSLAQ